MTWRSDRQKSLRACGVGAGIACASGPHGLLGASQARHAKLLVAPIGNGQLAPSAGQCPIDPNGFLQVDDRLFRQCRIVHGDKSLTQSEPEERFVRCQADGLLKGWDRIAPTAIFEDDLALQFMEERIVGKIGD